MIDNRFTQEVYPVEDAAQMAGFVLAPNLLKPDQRVIYHCQEKAQIRVGNLGPDIVECVVCGVRMLNLESPQVNGNVGWLPHEYTGNAWIVQKPVPVEVPVNAKKNLIDAIEDDLQKEREVNN